MKGRALVQFAEQSIATLEIGGENPVFYLLSIELIEKTNRKLLKIFQWTHQISFSQIRRQKSPLLLDFDQLWLLVAGASLDDVTGNVTVRRQ